MAFEPMEDGRMSKKRNVIVLKGKNYKGDKFQER